MIDHLAPKFRSTSLARAAVHEPRAAFLLNRFSDTLPILYATHATQFVLSCNPDEAVGRSFYEFIDDVYLLGAINAIERAKENDSIAYLRLLWKENLEDIEEEEEEDEEEDEEGEEGYTVQRPRLYQQSSQSIPGQPIPGRFEVECLVSASSDGLIVVVRRAPPIESQPPHVRPPGIFASPWATSPLAPYIVPPPPPPPIETAAINREVPEAIPSPPSPSNQAIMNSIRDISVFAWSIAMLNHNVSHDNASNIVDRKVSENEDDTLAPDEER